MRSYGYIKDGVDKRDLSLPKVSRAISLPKSVDLRPKMPPVYDQGQLGSCTANAIGAAFHFDELLEGLSPTTPSRLFIYYNERAIEGTINQDAGALIRDGAKVVNKLGVCPEASWPYIEAKFAIKPNPSCYVDGLKHQATIYQRVVQTESDLQGCLATGFPFVFGFDVYPYFESEAMAKDGVLKMPKKGETSVGGHAVLCVGYNAKYFIVRNSWGNTWGVGGYFYMPYAYMLSKMVSDIWTFRKVS